ncbi:trypsin-like serine peptidase [Spirillospora sp. NPDC048911]|uniref:trypsin-like serine peptidase n=1 Tax=Spirillospora sp. NPDC048911 TaxID=3364527 RepID=UPI003721DF35
MAPRPTGFVLVTAAVAAVAVSPGSAADAGASAAVRVVTHDVPSDPVFERQVRRYWTPERMTATAARFQPTATTGALWNSGGLVARTTGKIFFSVRGRDFLCSAGTVQSANRDVVVTAGHCVKAGRGPWAENWIFVPGYRDGAGPYGGFTARRMFTPDPWSQGGDGDYDVAMVAVAPSYGGHVVDLAGGQRIAFGGPHGRRTLAFGYPSAGGYDGERLAYCGGRPAGDPHEETTGQGLRCDLTRGASGGPWLSGFDAATGTGVITSVSSFKFADDHRTMYGPRFGDAVRRVYQRAQTG